MYIFYNTDWGSDAWRGGSGEAGCARARAVRLANNHAARANMLIPYIVNYSFHFLSLMSTYKAFSTCIIKVIICLTQYDFISSIWIKLICTSFKYILDLGNGSYILKPLSENPIKYAKKILIS